MSETDLSISAAYAKALRDLAEMSDERDDVAELLHLAKHRLSASDALLRRWAERHQTKDYAAIDADTRAHLASSSRAGQGGTTSVASGGLTVAAAVYASPGASGGGGCEHFYLGKSRGVPCQDCAAPAPSGGELDRALAEACGLLQRVDQWFHRCRDEAQPAHVQFAIWQDIEALLTKQGVAVGVMP